MGKVELCRTDVVAPHASFSAGRPRRARRFHRTELGRREMDLCRASRRAGWEAGPIASARDEKNPPPCGGGPCRGSGQSRGAARGRGDRPGPANIERPAPNRSGPCQSWGSRQRLQLLGDGDAQEGTWISQRRLNGRPYDIDHVAGMRRSLALRKRRPSRRLRRRKAKAQSSLKVL